jgi:hypothetical protein
MYRDMDVGFEARFSCRRWERLPALYLALDSISGS